MSEQRSVNGSGVVVVAPECYICQDCQVYEFPNSDYKAISLNVAVNRTFRNVDNQDSNNVLSSDFWNVDYIVPKKNKISEYLKKGTMITVTGSLIKEYWKNDDRSKPPIHVKIKADNVNFIRGTKKNEETSSNNSEDEWA